MQPSLLRRPIDEPLDDLTNVNALKKLVERAGRPIREPL